MAILPLLLAYLIGSIPFALLLTKRWGLADLRGVGSGNLGAANALRASGTTAGILVATLDIGKGAAGVLLADWLTPSANGVAAAGAAAVVGHIYPIWLRFRGGKGVATSCGVFGVLAPVPTLAALSAFAGGVWLTRYVSLGSVCASLMLPLAALSVGTPLPVVWAAAGVSCLVLFRHRSNLLRIWGGTERRFGTRLAMDRHIHQKETAR